MLVYLSDQKRYLQGFWAVSSVGRAPARQAGGHWFEPSTAHHRTRWKRRVSHLRTPPQPTRARLVATEWQRSQRPEPARPRPSRHRPRTRHLPRPEPRTEARPPRSRRTGARRDFPLTEHASLRSQASSDFESRRSAHVPSFRDLKPADAIESSRASLRSTSD